MQDERPLDVAQARAAHVGLEGVVHQHGDDEVHVPERMEPPGGGEAVLGPDELPLVGDVGGALGGIDPRDGTQFVEDGDLQPLQPDALGAGDRTHAGPAGGGDDLGEGRVRADGQQGARERNAPGGHQTS